MNTTTFDRAAARTAILLAIDTAITGGWVPTRNERGELTCNHYIGIGLDGRAIHVSTSKSSRGGVSCRAIVGQRTELGASGYSGFSFALFQDWSRDLVVDRKARATAKAVATMHVTGLHALKGCVDSILDQYAPAAVPAIEEVEDAAELAEGAMNDANYVGHPTHY